MRSLRTIESRYKRIVFLEDPEFVDSKGVGVPISHALHNSQYLIE